MQQRNIDIYKAGGGVLDGRDSYLALLKALPAMVFEAGKTSRILVVSAFGSMTADIQNIIDMLAAKEPSESITPLVDRIRSGVESLIGFKCSPTDTVMTIKHLNDFRALVIRTANSGRPIPDKVKAQILQYGELISSSALFEALKRDGEFRGGISYVDSRRIVRTGHANPLEETHNEAATQYAFENVIAQNPGYHPEMTFIMPGFIASSIEGEVPTLLGLEGSDYTAAILANAAHRSSSFGRVSLTYLKNFPGISLDYKGDGASSVISPAVNWEQMQEKADRGEKALHKKVIGIMNKIPVPVLVTSLDYFSNKNANTPFTIIKD